MQGILFDLDYTLYDYSCYLRQAFAFASQHLITKFELDEVKLNNAFFQTNKLLPLHAHNFMNVWLQKACLPNSYLPFLLEAYRACTPTNLVPYPHAVSLLKFLKNKGFSIGLLTDGRTIMQQRKLLSLGLAPLFDAMLFTADFNTEKPNPLVFREAAARLGVDPTHCTMVGDNLLKDVFGALDVGMKAIWFNNGPIAAEQLFLPKPETISVLNLLDLQRILVLNE